MLQCSKGRRLFLRQARENFLHTGAIAPSSRFVARAATWPLAKAGRPIEVLEAGAGTGALTTEIIHQLPSGSHLDIYEINPVFAGHLERRFGGRDDVQVNNLGVNEIPPEPRYDVVVSGLPFNNFSPDDVSEMLSRLIGALKPGGLLTYFEYILIREIKLLTSPRHRRRLLGVGSVTRRFQKEFGVRKEAVFRNIPPAFVHTLRKPD